MPYRGQPEPGARCHRHDAAPAAASCARCLKTICDICLVYDHALPHCPECARRARRMRSITRLATLVAVLAVIAGSAIYLATRKHAFDYGKFGPELRTLSEKLEREPCHRPTALAYADQLLDAGDSRAVLVHVDGFIKKCGDWHRLRWLNYSAHKQLSEFQAAADDATHLIEDRPQDQDFWWWRGQMWQQLGKHDQAIDDYRQSHALMPKANYIPFDLSALLEKQGRPCEAITPVEIYLNYHTDHRQSPLVVARLERLTSLCPSYYGAGLASLKVDDQGFARDNKARIGDQRVQAVVDWSAPFTIIGAALASKLSLPSSGPKLQVGGRSGYLVTIPSLTLGEATARDVEAVVLPNSDLIVGLTYLSRFDFSDDGERLNISQR